MTAIRSGGFVDAPAGKENCQAAAFLQNFSFPDFESPAYGTGFVIQ